MTGFSKQQRLLTKADYNTVFSKSVKVSNASFLILIHQSSKLCSRLGLVISKKVDKRAVQRNRIKRICRETFRKHSFKTNCDLVILARPNTSTKSSKELHKMLNQLWQQVDLKIQQIRNKA
ncbi:MAG: ribonuclease P protein component [Proteobacteria bacterium]|nr:ribonuclease P protein component [Pseudomonadota bacterium]